MPLHKHIPAVVNAFAYRPNADDFIATKPISFAISPDQGSTSLSKFGVFYEPLPRLKLQHYPSNLSSINSQFSADYQRILLSSTSTDSIVSSFEVVSIPGEQFYLEMLTRGLSGNQISKLQYQSNILKYERLINDKTWELLPEGIANVLLQYNVNGVKVVGARQPAITNLPSTATLADVITKINTILATMRQHGLITP